MTIGRAEALCCRHPRFLKRPRPLAGASVDVKRACKFPVFSIFDPVIHIFHPVNGADPKSRILSKIKLLRQSQLTTKPEKPKIPCIGAC
jgi:hypothetical protein